MHVTEVVRVAAEAWREVKPAEDPDFNNCALSHREKLVAEVEGVIRTNTARTDFEKAVKRILDRDLKAPEPEPEPAPAPDPAPEPASEVETETSEPAPAPAEVATVPPPADEVKPAKAKNPPKSKSAK